MKAETVMLPTENGFAAKNIQAEDSLRLTCKSTSRGRVSKLGAEVAIAKMPILSTVVGADSTAKLLHHLRLIQLTLWMFSLSCLRSLHSIKLINLD